MNWKRTQDTSIKTALAGVRNDLLDLSAKNPLINYKPSKTRGIPRLVIGSTSALEHLVLRRGHFSFSADDQTLQPEFMSSRRLGTVQQLRVDPTDEREDVSKSVLSVKTNLRKSELDSRLLASYYAAQASIEEEGAITLYLTIGTLQWPGDPSRKEQFVAPLLMIPVKLDRASISYGFRLSYSGDGIFLNFCLAELLRRRNIQLPILAEVGELNLPDYFLALRRATVKHSDLYIDPETVSVSLFSFSKFLMYKDLDPDQWVKQGILRNEYLAKLMMGASLTPDQAPLSEEALLDDAYGDKSPNHVVDADSSQARAIFEVGRGDSLVIQGPPGTGKSQTIVNIIADSIANGKTVLFVSEKSAALEVVKNRLDAIGLRSSLLELHSNRSSRRSIYEQLKETLDLRHGPNTPVVPDYESLKSLQCELNSYCSIVNTPCFPTHETPYMIFGSITRLMEKFKDGVIPQLELEDARTWTLSEIQAQRNHIGRIQSALTGCRQPVSNPFWGVTTTVISAITRERLKQLFQEAHSAIEAVESRSDALANTLGQERPRSIEEVLIQIETADLCLDAPPLKDINLQSEVWAISPGLIQECLSDGDEYAEIFRKWRMVIGPEGWRKDVGPLIQSLKQLQGRWWKGISGADKALLAQVNVLLLKHRAEITEDTLPMLADIERSQDLSRRIDGKTSVLQKVFGANWRGALSDWSLLRSQSEWVEKMIARSKVGELPAWLAPVNKAGFNRSALLEDIQAAKWAYSNYLSTRETALSLLLGDSPTSSLLILDNAGSNLERLKSAYVELHTRIHELTALARYLQVRAECVGQVDKKVLTTADRWQSAHTHLMDAFELSRLSSLLEHVFTLNPSLNYFDGDGHSKRVQEFRALDKASLMWSRSAIAALHLDRIKKASNHRQAFDSLMGASETGQGFPPIRKLMAQYAPALQILKPVFMMSPTSVATFLPPDEIQFDLVIFDEASQLRPTDALGSIARAKQVVIVGDSKQLPPTNYFIGSGAREDEFKEQTLENFESILGFACARGARQHLLRWHYRSKHESLIAQSNYSFYDNQLIVFPSPDRRRVDVGLVYRHVPLDDMIDSSGLSSHQREAAMVARAVMERVAEQMNDSSTPKYTFGVATLNTRQRDLILEELELLRNEQPKYEEFFATEQHEPFFVKNLENVQGDERDVIYISLGCGDGLGMPVPVGLGPLLREGGERRLNVLFTRARRRCEVFTTLRSADILITEQSPSGLATFKSFLQYAEHGRIRRPIVSTDDAPSVFETQVAQVIERYGFTVQRNVGPSGLLLDLAVVDPQEPERYLLGVLCDGPSYGQPRSCRDRNRLRESTLRDIGWTVYRIWSTAWVQNRSQEEGKLLAALSDATKKKEAILAIQTY